MDNEDFKKVDLLWFSGPCSFFFCTEKGLHFHPVCPKCGAVRFGNFFCDYCQEQYKIFYGYFKSRELI